MPGMGFSSRPDPLPIDSIDSCIDYFVSRILAFVDKLGLGTFNIIGHSLGALVAAHFFRKHSERVCRLILLSPAGMNNPTLDQYARLMTFIDEKNFFANFGADVTLDAVKERAGHLCFFDEEVRSFGLA